MRQSTFFFKGINEFVSCVNKDGCLSFFRKHVTSLTNPARDPTGECLSVSAHHLDHFVSDQDTTMTQDVFQKCGKLMADIGFSHSVALKNSA